MNKCIALALTGLLLFSGGCANVPLGERFTAVDPSRDDKALLYIYRPYSHSSSAYGVLISVDEDEKVALPVGSYTRIYVDPGRHHLRFSWPLISLQRGMEGDFKFETGGIYFLRYSVINTGTLWTYSAESVPSDTAIAELKCCSFSRPADDKP